METKFKVGDLVKIVNINGWSTLDEYRYCIGIIARVTDVCEKERPVEYFLDNNKYGINFTDSMLERVTFPSRHVYNETRPLDTSSLYGDALLDSPRFFYSDKPINNSLKEKAMSVLNTLSARLKRTLNPNLRAFYQLGWMDGDLEVTSDGRQALVDFLFDENEDKLGKVASKKVKDLKKKERDEE